MADHNGKNARFKRSQVYKQRQWESIYMKEIKSGVKHFHTSAKLAKRMFGVPSGFLQLKKPPCVIHEVLLVF